MSDIRTARIGEIADTYAGGTPARDFDGYYGGLIPWVKSGEVDSSSITTTEETITEDGLSSSSAKWVSRANPLVAMYGATAGKVGWLEVDAATNQAVLAVVPTDRRQTDSKWLYWALLHIAPKLLSRQQGSGQPNLNKQLIDSQEVFWPPHNQQSKIAQILDTLDTQLRQTEALLAKLEQLKQGLLTDLLTRGIDANGQLRLPPEQAPHLYKDSPLGRIPREWCIAPLSDLAEVNRGKFTHRPRNDPAYYGGSYPFIQTGDVAAAKGDVVERFSQTLSRLGTTASAEFPKGTIAITIAANIADTGILGRPMYFPDSIVGAVVKKGVSTRYIELCIRAAKSGLEARAPQSAQKNINLQDLRPLPIALPTLAEQEKIAHGYDSLSARISSEKRQLEKLAGQKSALMNDLLTGRVRVTPLLDKAELAAS